MANIISGTYSTAVTLGSISDNPTTITASGTLSDGLVTSYPGLTVVNAGQVIAPSSFGAGVRMEGGSVTNQSGGTISGYLGIYGVTAAVTVVNAGSITGGTNGVGLRLIAGASVTNQSGGTISGLNGIVDSGGALTVVNAGSIASSVRYAVRLEAGGSVTNLEGGSISGLDGVFGSSGIATVVNAGSITGSGKGVDLLGGGSVTNQSDGAISGEYGIYGKTDAATVVNAGSITGSSKGVDLLVGGSVTNQSGGSISGRDGIYGKTDAMTVVNAGSITGNNDIGIGVFLNSGGSVTNQSGGSISAYYGVSVEGSGATVVNAGTITGVRYAVKFAAGSANRLIADPGAVFAGRVYGANGVLELASAASAGTLSGFGTNINNFGTLQFDAGAAWTVSGSDVESGLGTIAITGFANGDTIDLTYFAAVSDTFASNALVLTDAENDHFTLSIEGSFTSSSFQLSSDGNEGTDVVVCFAAGTEISTPAGEVQVEKLKAGDLVLTAHNGPRAVKWIGHGKVLATRGRRSAATPVIVRKGALADNVPNRDLHVTKAHSLYIDDVLIPVEFLVNHRTIQWDDRAQEVTIYHVELDSHDVLLANGAPAESYRDDGNRWLFQNANSGWHLPPQAPYAPVLTGGPIVDAVWRQLLDRAGPRALPPLTDEPDLHLIVDGMRVDAEERQGAVYIFRLPPSPKSVVIASREIVPAEFGIARDPRSLGVALRRVAVRQGAKFTLFDAADERLTVGFHQYEADGHLRWTDGYAELPAETLAGFDHGAEVMLHLGGATQYPDDRASVARAAA